MATIRQMKATARQGAGKGAARAERRRGRVPGVVYGDGKPPVNVSVDHAELKQRIYAGRFLTTIYELDVDGAKQRVIRATSSLTPSGTCLSMWISCVLVRVRKFVCGFPSMS